MPRAPDVSDIDALDLSDLQRLNTRARCIRFAPHTEREFRAQYTETMVPVLRYGLLLAVALIGLITVLDWLVLPPDSALRSTALRSAFMLPAIAAVYALSHAPRWHRHLTPAALVLSLVVGLTLLAVAAGAHPVQAANPVAGMMVTIIYAYLLYGLRLGWAACAGVPLMIATVASLAAAGAPAGTVAYGALFLAFANLVGAAGCYLLEMLGRRIFVESRLLRRLAGRDGLTRISNRRAFDNQLARTWTRAAEAGRRLGVVLVDVDFFKAYNDRYGHQAGDDCLTQVAEALIQSARRPGDFVARYGGDEFAILAEDPPRDYLEKLSKKVHVNVCTLALPHDAGGVGGRVTVSIGASMLRPCLDWDPRDAVGTADEALYRAKVDGRNRTVRHNTDAAMESTAVIRDLCRVS